MINEVRADAVERFEAFGYVHLPEAISRETSSTLFHEIDRELERAFTDTAVPPTDDDGRVGYFMPAMTPRTPTSLELMSALAPVARKLLGVDRVAPVFVDTTVFFGPTPWHTDLGIPIGFVKFGTYADRLTGDTGALRFVAGSHQPPLFDRCKAMVRRLERDERRPVEETVTTMPHVVVDTTPGDLVAIGPKVLHSTIGGKRRVQWSLPFIDVTDEDLARRFYANIFVPASRRGHDGIRQPFYDEAWLAREPELAELLHRLGAIDAATRCAQS